MGPCLSDQELQPSRPQPGTQQGWPRHAARRLGLCGGGKRETCCKQAAEKPRCVAREEPERAAELGRGCPISLWGFLA